jgi:hypothetical protein
LRIFSLSVTFINTISDNQYKSAAWLGGYSPQPAPIYFFDPFNTAANKPAIGWFLFPIFPVEKKMYFMLRSSCAITGNVCAELAT